MNDFIITSCPSCDGPLVWSETNIDLFCRNTECPEQMYLAVAYFLNRLGCENVGVDTIKNLNIKTVMDVYSLTVGDIENREGFGRKSAEVIVNEIAGTLVTSPHKVLSAFGMPNVGRTTSKEILKVHDFDSIWTLEADDYLEIFGVGKVIANTMASECSEFKPLYDFLVDKGLTWASTSNTLSGQSFCFTGTAPMKRDDLVKMVEDNGGEVKGMSRKIDALVTNNPESTSGKAKKAIDYGVNVISYDQLLEMM